MIKIAVLVPANEFTPHQIKRLKCLGGVKFINKRRVMSLVELEKFCRGCRFLAADPDTLGGFKAAKLKLVQLVSRLPDVTGVAVPTSYTGWIDTKFFQQRKIPVCFTPGYSTEAVAEHTLALMLMLAKKTYQKKIVLGKELKGKTLGIIGLGKIGRRVAELALGIGMKVVAYNRSPIKQKRVELVTLKKLLKLSNVISVHITDNPNNENFIGGRELNLIKNGVIVINTTGNSKLINELAMAKTLKSGKLFGYAYEGDNLKNTLLAKFDNVIGLPNFAWYTRESLVRLADIWIDNIAGLIKGKPINLVT